jgi:hypothetical protein
VIAGKGALRESLEQQVQAAAAIADRLEAILAGSLILPTRKTCRDYATAHFDWRVLASKIQKVLVLY